MGGSTFLIGLIPSYSSIGYAAPILVLILRLVQGLALGGEYGGAATYVAEHAPVGKRGFFTSWIQTTATLGTLPFIGSDSIDQECVRAIKLCGLGLAYPVSRLDFARGVSIYIRMKMHESPVFTKLKAEGKVSANPLKESFQKKANFKMVLASIVRSDDGAGCGVVHWPILCAVFFRKYLQT
jgi:MFS family permease